MMQSNRRAHHLNPYFFNRLSKTFFMHIFHLHLSFASGLTAVPVSSLPFALGIAGSIRVGTLLGGNRPKEARRATNVLLALTTGGALATATGFLLARRYIGLAFTTDADVVQKIARWVQRRQWRGAKRFFLCHVSQEKSLASLGLSATTVTPMLPLASGNDAAGSRQLQRCSR